MSCSNDMSFKNVDFYLKILSSLLLSRFFLEFLQTILCKILENSLENSFDIYQIHFIEVQSCIIEKKPILQKCIISSFMGKTLIILIELRILYWLFYCIYCALHKYCLSPSEYAKIIISFSLILCVCIRNFTQL